MATSFVILCPECEKQIKVREEVIGKKIRCKECDSTFVVKKPKNLRKPREEDEDDEEVTTKKEKPKAKKESPVEPTEKPDEEEAVFKLKEEPKEEKPKPAAKKKPSDDDDDDNADPYSLTTNDDMVPRCPFCTHELESAQTVVCKECGYNMVTRRRHETARVHEATGEEKFKWRLPGYLCIAGIVTMLVICIVCFVKTKGWMKDSWFEDDEDHTYIVKPGCFQLFNVMVTGFLCFSMGKFAYKRLAIDNMPPERLIEEGDAEAAAEAEAELHDDEDD